MSIDARDAALRQAEAQGYRRITAIRLRQVGQGSYEVDLASDAISRPAETVTSDARDGVVPSTEL